MTALTPAQLANLVDRAARHLTAEEGVRLRAGVEALESARLQRDLVWRALDRANALVDEWRGDQMPVTRADAAEVLAEVTQLDGWTRSDAGSPQSPAESLGAPEPRATAVRPSSVNVAAPGGSRG